MAMARTLVATPAYQVLFDMARLPRPDATSDEAQHGDSDESLSG